MKKDYKLLPNFYRSYHDMKKRCYNSKCKDFKFWGGRGIKISKKWLGRNGYETFKKDMLSSWVKGLTLDRIDNNKNYSVKNCRWLSRKEQCRNTRRNIVYKNEYATDACKRLGGASGLIKMRLNYGWTIKKAFTTPILIKKKLL